MEFLGSHVVVLPHELCEHSYPLTRRPGADSLQNPRGLGPLTLAQLAHTHYDSACENENHYHGAEQ